MKNRINFIELENHLNEWFGHDWNNQSSTQILAMTISLLAKVGVEILSEEDLKNESELNALETRILGIVGNTLYIQGFYAGDYYHQLLIPAHELNSFIDSGRIPIYDNINYIECQTHGMTYDQYMEYLERYNEEY